MIRENIESVEERICAACRRAGRDRSEVSLICVTKTKPVEMLQEAYDVGQRDFGENKVQEICRKKPELPADIRWHMIGHLQRNKVRQLIGQAVMIHSVDSLRLAETISTEALRAGIRIPVLIEVNMAGEESKYGVSPEQTEELIRAAASQISAVTVQSVPPSDTEGRAAISAIPASTRPGREPFSASGAFSRASHSYRSGRTISSVENSPPDRVTAVTRTDPVTALAPDHATGWEDMVNRNCVLKVGDVYKMWYTGQAHGNSYIGVAESDNGLDFRRVSAKPVLSPAAGMPRRTRWKSGATSPRRGLRT